jgi:drug/metabolite transporter (DMT)-like permease
MTSALAGYPAAAVATARSTIPAASASFVFDILNLMVRSSVRNGPYQARADPRAADRVRGARRLGGVAPLALALVLVAAFGHAVWNAFAKRAPGGAAFVWSQTLVGLVCLLPFALAAAMLDDSAHISRTIVALAIVSGFLHSAYFVLLQRGYAAGDLSLVYPLARGTGPMFATAGAIILLGEHPGPLALGGTAMIAVGVVLLLVTRGLARGRALAYALLTGLLIGVYTVWDGHAVRASHAEPLVYLLIASSTIALVLAPAALRNRPDLQLLRRDHLRIVAIVGVLVTLSYALVLFATRIAGVAYVAPVREVSILIGAAIGTYYYAERGGWQRIAGAAAIVAGVIALALG